MSERPERLTWADLGIEVRNPGAAQERVICPKCTPGRKPGHQRLRDLNLNLVDGVGYCHHCGLSVSLVSGWSDDPLPTRRRDLPKWERPQPVPDADEAVLAKSLDWFRARGIAPEAVERMGVTASTGWCTVCQKEVGWIHFPYFLHGEHVNTKHRDGHKHFRMESGARRVLWNVDNVDPAQPVVIVEGEMDVLALLTAGITNVVSVPDGAPDEKAKNYASKFDFLTASEDLFTGETRFILATDADAPGRKLADELARRIGPEKCSRVTWDAEHKDANECLMQAGPDYLRAIIEDARPMPVEGIYTGHDLVTDLVRFYDEGEAEGVGFGYTALDEHYRVHPGQVTVVIGIPSHGKSTVLDQLLLRLAEREGFRFAIFSPEQQPLWRHQRALIEQHVGKPVRPGPTPHMSKEEMLAANDWLSERFSFLLPDHPGLDRILELAKVEVFRRGIKGIVIDPYNELEHLRPRHMSETDYANECMSKIHQFAWKTGLHVWVVVHPTKLRGAPGDKQEPVPTLWDANGSAAFRNKADVGLSIWRDLDGDQNVVEVHIKKMRFQDHGKLGIVQFRYTPSTRRLQELGAL